MSHRVLSVSIRLGAFGLAMLLAACDPAPKGDTSGQPPPPAPTREVPADSSAAPTEIPAPDESPAAPAQPAADPPPPTEPSPVPKPTADEPALEAMKPALASAKAGVPVDLRYSFDGDPLTNQPVTLHLAAVPRVAGSNLGVSLKAADGIRIAAAGGLAVQKASANGAYRQSYSVTREASAPGQLRVLVTMDMAEGSGFGFYSIPFGDVPKSSKLDSVKQR